MFKVNNKDSRTKPIASFRCLYCLLWSYFTPCSTVSIVNFEHVIADWTNSENKRSGMTYFEKPLQNCDPKKIDPIAQIKWKEITGRSTKPTYL